MNKQDYEYLNDRLEETKLTKQPLSAFQRNLLMNNLNLLWLGYCHGAKLYEEDKKLGRVMIIQWIEDNIEYE